MAAATESIDVVIGAKALYEATLKKAQSDFDKYGKSVVAIYVKIKAAQIALTKAWDLADAAARFDQQEQAFTNLAASHGENARQIIRNLQAISGHTVSTAAIMQSAGTAMILGIPAEHLSKMMEIAKSSGKLLGETTEVMFEKLTVGLARMSALRLDDLGIKVKATEANKVYADSLNIVGRELTKAEKEQAFFNAAMKSGQDIIDRVGESNFSAADATAVFTATMEDMKIVAGKTIITVTSSLTGIAFAISKVFAQMLKTAATGIGKLDQLLANIPFYKATPGILEFAEAQGAAAKEAGRLRDKSFDVAIAIWKEKEAVEGLAKAKKKAIEEPEESAGELTPEADSQIQATLLRMQYRDEEIMQMTLFTDAMAYHAERGVAITEGMAASIVVANQRMAWSAQARSSMSSKANSAMQQSILGLVETGKFSVGAFAKIMAQQAKIELTGIAAKAGVQAIYYTARGLAATAASDPRAAGWFAAAGQMALITGAAAAAAATVHAVAGGTAEKPAPGTAGGEPIRTQGAGSLIGSDVGGDQPGTTVNVHLNVDGMISPDSLSRMIEEHVAPELERYSDRGGQVRMNVVSSEAA